MHLDQDTETWTRHRLQRQRQRSTIHKTSSSSTTGTIGTSRRSMVQRTGRQRWDCHYFDNEGPRTNNHLEGWHGRLKKHLNHAHPNIFVLIELLQKTQANTSKPDPDICRRHATTQVKEIQKHLQQSSNTQRFLQAELTVQDYTDIPSPHGNSTVV